MRKHFKNLDETFNYRGGAGEFSQTTEAGTQSGVRSIEQTSTMSPGNIRGTPFSVSNHHIVSGEVIANPERNVFTQQGHRVNI